MMRRLYYAANAIFWLMVAALWGGSLWPAPERVRALPAERVLTLAKLAAHAQPEDCWMAIQGSVYDVSAYLPDHPSRSDIIFPWCGKDATWAYETKTRGRSHTPLADQLLANYRIGSLAPDNP